ncbi:histone-fold-containing protein [Mycena leptocephala]|nr:histone-fold-containing protein [Mycena leptocephala]
MVSTVGKGKGGAGKGKAIGAQGRGKTSWANTTSTRVSSSVKAGLVFPVGRIHRLVKQGKYAPRVTFASAVYFAAVLEYLMAELLELAGNCARDNHKQRIIPRHLLLAIRNDGELDRLLKNTIITEGGVVPFIHSELIAPRRGKRHLIPSCRGSKI